MVKDNQIVWCSIMKYLNDNHANVANYVSALCVERLLEFNRFNKGVTFLLPKDKGAILNELDKLDIKGSVEDANKAHDIICSLVIHQHLGSAREWKTAASSEYGIKNCALRKINVASATDSEVKLSNGASLKLDSAFKSMGTDANNKIKLAVWFIDGPAPLDGEKIEFKRNDIKKGKKSDAVKTGKGEEPQMLENFNNKKLELLLKLLEMQKKWLHSAVKNGEKPSAQKPSPIKKFVDTLKHFIAKAVPELYYSLFPLFRDYEAKDMLCNPEYDLLILFYFGDNTNKFFGYNLDLFKEFLETKPIADKYIFDWSEESYDDLVHNKLSCEESLKILEAVDTEKLMCLNLPEEVKNLQETYRQQLTTTAVSKENFINSIVDLSNKFINTKHVVENVTYVMYPEVTRKMLARFKYLKLVLDYRVLQVELAIKHLYENDKAENLEKLFFEYKEVLEMLRADLFIDSTFEANMRLGSTIWSDFKIQISVAPQEDIKEVVGQGIETDGFMYVNNVMGSYENEDFIGMNEQNNGDGILCVRKLE